MKPMNNIYTQKYVSPCGELLLGSFDGVLCICDWINNRRHESIINGIRQSLDAKFSEISTSVIESAAKALDEYFAGKSERFSIPLLLVGSDFRKIVWNALMNIGYGQTVSYGELSRLIRRPTAVRAVANAVGANPISIFVPCHRVIGSDGSVTGYVGGLDAKRYLLSLERR